VEVVYARESFPLLGVEEFRDVLVRSRLGARRPIDQPLVLEAMLRNADLILTARVRGLLVGISRAITDYSFCTYLSDLAVDVAFQRRGIGRRLIELTHEAAGKGTMLVLLAAPLAREYYPHIGLVHHDSCWTIPRVGPADR